MTTDLKPCPFCGETASIVRVPSNVIRWVVICDDDKCAARGSLEHGTADAIAAWNRRVPTDEALDRISCALGLGAPAAPVDDMVTEIGRLQDGDRAQMRTLKDLTLLRCLVLEYFRVKKYAAEAWAPGGTTADRETWANAEMEAEEALRKAVMK